MKHKLGSAQALGQDPVANKPVVRSLAAEHLTVSQHQS